MRFLAWIIGLRQQQEPDCKCEKTWEFYPDMKSNEVYHSDSRSGLGPTRVTHGMKLVCCHECGKVHFEDYAQ